jgi:aldose 1-epimerase
MINKMPDARRAKMHPNIPVRALLPLFFALYLACACSQAASVRQLDFGTLEDGTAVGGIELSNANGVAVRIMALGATIQSLQVPDSEGNSEDIVLGHNTAAEYLRQPQYYGATVGRYANRIAAGKFTLDGKSYALELNDGTNHLHGGVRGFDKVIWEIESAAGGSAARAVLTHTSPDGAGGYPGTLQVRAEFTLSDNNELDITYEATTDQPTIVNITNHAYFNLAGEAGDDSIMGHELTLNADRFTPVDATLIPTGELRSVGGTPFDFRSAQPIGARVRDGGDQQLRYGRGYDHNFVINDADGTLRMAAVLHDPASGRVMELLTTAPGVQFYSGNFLNASTVGKSGHIYRQGDALCLEPQVYPDAPNQPDFPTSRLDPGETYRNTMLFRFKTQQQ